MGSNELILKRHAEITCLGLSPRLYYSACKLLDRHITTVYKDGILYQFKNKEFPELNDETDDERFPFSDAVDLVETTFALSNQLSTTLIIEWRRDKVINKVMSKDVSKYWKYISLPNHIT